MFIWKVTWSLEESSTVRDCRFEDCANSSRASCSGALQVGELTDGVIHGNVIREHRGAYGIKTWRSICKRPDTWYIFGRNRIRLVRVKFSNNDIKTRQGCGSGNGLPNLNLALWNSAPEDGEIHHNLEINYNVFRYGCYPIASWGGPIRNLYIHDNTFQGARNTRFTIERPLGES